MAEFMLHIIKVNVLSAVIIFIVLAVSRLLDKKYSSRWKYLIWLFVSVFLLIPVRLPSNARGLTIEVPKQITRTEYAGSTNALAAKTAKIPTDSTKNSSNEQTMTNDQADMQDSAGENAKDSVSPRENIKIDTIAWFMAYIWGAGICVAVVYKLFMLRAGRRELRRWRIPFTNSERIAEYNKLCKKMHIKKAPKLVASSKLSGPLLAGIRNTYLYLPERDYSGDECELIFRHELCHYRNRDLWYKLLMIWITTVYWFNPAVYFMKKEAERDIEFICDESVMKGRNHEDKLRYNQLLLKTAALGRHPYELSTSLNDGLLTFKRRMVNIMKAGKMKKGILPVICFTILLVMSNVFTGCSLKDSGEKQKKADTEAAADNVDSKEDEKPSGKEEEDSKEKVINGKAVIDPDTKAKTETPIQAEPEEKPTDPPKTEPTPAKTEPTELSGFMNRDALPSMVQNLGLQQASGVAFGDMGMRYEGNGIDVEWDPDTNGIAGRALISISCENNSSVSMEGIRCGEQYKEAETNLLQSGYRNLGDSDPSHKEFISDSESKIISIDVSDASISAWSWMNWPQGDFAPITTQYMPVDGDYKNASDGEYATIRITGINDNSFYFTIYKYIEGQGEQQIFMDNIAVFEERESSTAVFRGQQYTLTFDCSEYGTIKLSGFDDAITLGDTFWNSQALHTS